MRANRRAVISRRFPLGRVADAYRALQAASRGKALIGGVVASQQSELYGMLQGERMYLFLATAIFGAGMAMGAIDGFVSLMPRRDVTELWTIEGTPPSAWRVEKREILCKGKPNGFLRSKKTYRNYILRAEWRFKKEGWVPKPEDEGWPNAGFFINAGTTVDGWPTSQEVQGHFGEAGSLFGVRGGEITGARRGALVKDRVPFGEWDRYEITNKDGKVTVMLNGKLVNEGTGAKPSQGNVCLQSEGWEVHYRNVEIKELP